MAISIYQKTLIPVRRDKQVPLTGGSSGGGGSVNIVGGGGGTSYDDTEVRQELSGNTNSLSTSISSETSTRISGDNTLSTSISSETSTRISGDNILSTSISSEASTRLSVDNTKLSLSGGTMTGSELLTKNASNLQSDTYVSGYAGNGFKLDNSTTNTLEVDNLKVRNKLSVYTLEINEVTSIGGGLVISAANGIAYSISGTTRFFFDTNGGNSPIQFVVNDYVKAQLYFQGSAQNYLGLVTNVVQSTVLGSAYIDCTTQSGSPWSGMKLVQFGNTSTTSRQNLIYITSTDTNAPYLDMCSNVTAGSLSGKQVLRIGNLAGITDATFGSLSGYGLFSSNVYLTGGINANTGLIGGWYINSTYLVKDTGTASTSSGMAPSDYPFYAGSTYANRATAPFRVTPNGSLTATGCISLGTAAVSYSGSYYNAAINGSDIYESSFAGDISYLYINRIGYQGGTSYYRYTTIGDGKNNTLANFRSGTILLNTDTTVQGKLYVYGLTTHYANIDATSYTVTGSNFILASDKRLKENIKPLSNNSANIEYKQFNLIKEPNRVRYGVLAQDLENIYPELITKGSDGMLGVDYTGLLILEINSLKKKISELEKMIN